VVISTKASILCGYLIDTIFITMDERQPKLTKRLHKTCKRKSNKV